MAIVTNWGIYVGEDAEITDTIYLDGTTIVAPITDWNLAFSMHAANNPTILVTKVSGDGISSTNPETGVFSVILAASDTTGLSEGNYTYVVERTDVGADTVLTTGTIVLKSR